MGEFALLIPILALCIPFYAIWTGHKTKVERMRMEHEARGFGQLNSELGARLQRIEDRIAVLERIVTDRGTSLSDEIEQLRRSA